MSQSPLNRMEGEEEYSLEGDILESYRAIVAHRIVDEIRDHMSETLESEGSEGIADPWNEEKGGVGWVDNEVGMAIELLRILFPEDDYPDLSECENVEECEEVLSEEFELYHLHFIDFIIQFGSSSSRAFFALREHDRDYILQWCQRRGFEF